MKRTVSVVLGVILLTVLSMNALALTLTDVTFGSSSQERGANLTAQVTLKNDGPVNITSITLSHSAASKFQVSLGPTAVAVLTPGAEVQIQVNATIPSDHPAVDSKGKDIVQEIGRITATGTNTTGSTITTSSAVKMQAESKLIINEGKIIINDIEETVKDGETVEDVKPGDKFCVEAELENKFRDEDDDPTIEDIDTFAEIDDDDFPYSEPGEDVDELDPRDEEIEKFDCDYVDDEADGTMTLLIGTTGKVGNTLHGDQMTVKIKIERESHELLIRRAELRPSRVTTDAKSLQLSVQLFNAGKRDEDEASVTVSAPELGIEETFADLEVDKSDELSRVFSLRLPADLKAGTYDIQVRAAPTGNSFTDTETITLTVAERVTTTPPPTTQPPATTPPATTPPVELPPLLPPQDTTPARAWLSNRATLGLLIAGIAVALVLIIVLLVVALRK